MSRGQVEDRINLWDSISEWSNKVNEWKKSPFLEIETETISKEAESYTKILMR